MNESIFRDHDMMVDVDVGQPEIIGCNPGEWRVTVSLPSEVHLTPDDADRFGDALKTAARVARENVGA